MNTTPETPAVTEPTIAEKLATAGLTELAETKVAPLATALGLEVKHYGYDENYNYVGRDDVTIQQELAKLHKIIANHEYEARGERSKLNTLRMKVSRLEEYLDENWDTMHEGTREELCEMFDIEQEVTKTITITVSGTVEVTAPRGFDWDNLDDTLNVDVSVTGSTWHSEVSVSDFDQDDLTIEE
jgi:hypothetical protein